MDNEIVDYLIDELKMLAILYRTRSGYKRNKGYKAKRYRAIAYGLEKSVEIVKRYGKELELQDLDIEPDKKI